MGLKISRNGGSPEAHDSVRFVLNDGTTYDVSCADEPPKPAGRPKRPNAAQGAIGALVVEATGSTDVDWRKVIGGIESWNVVDAPDVSIADIDLRNMSIELADAATSDSKLRAGATALPVRFDVDGTTHRSVVLIFDD